ncbi:hypothetical protein BDY21DRAFT_349300 [Lineolata rhizophorae]|uniref:Uncharacterized protein n=1 Tax=Lineolata rhizophorae TaxID=578093 RepID=A0A6A6NWZ5_9PEZI|nr:hypothetical protein BDY21DRAFT_349300 [Lineolata rhizophorae]
MYIPGYIDDTVVPANASESRPFYRWLVCDILYVAYRYRTLAWTLGVAEPQNPSCVAVNVTREFP